MATQPNTFSRMPGPRSRDAPRFNGKRVIRFLADYEYCADAAGLSPEQRILQITRYCDTKSEEFIESLDEYSGKDWVKLKNCLLDCYPSEEEKPYYKVDDLLKFVRKDRKLPTIEKFDEYFREFTVIAKSLEARQALSETDKHDYFWRGIKPPTFREEIAIAMKNSKLWTDLTNPPPMGKVKEVIKQRLKRDLYRVVDDDGKYADDDESQGTNSDNSSDESGSSDSESDREYRRTRAKRRNSKHDVRTKRDGPAPKATETKPQEPVEPPKSNIDDLAEKIGRLTIALGQFDNDKAPRRSVRFTPGSALRCFMCGENGHSIKDCPESKAFIAKKVLKITNEGRLVQADGSDLPYGDIDNGGVARILREQIANASNAETEYLQEFLTFNDYEYEVFPAERDQEAAVKPKRAEPYNKDDRKGKSPQRPNRAYVELPSRRPQPVPTKNVEEPPPTILTRGASDPADPERPAGATDRDSEMHDITPESITKDVRNQTEPGKTQNKSKSKDKDKVSLDDVVIRDKSDFAKKRASPAYRFASELQENVDIENLFKAIMDKEIPVKIGDVLGSSFELCRRLQTATKTQRIPVAQATVAIPNVPANKRFRTQVSHIEVDLDDANDNTNQRNSGYFWKNRPKVRIRNAEVDSDDETDDESNASEFTTNTDDEAELYYQRQLENEHKRLFYAQATDYSVRPSFLAMVTAKIQGTIMKDPCTMLIDSGSELNMMVQKTQERLELPLDPSGADWLLRGVSGHQVRLVGLCRNVPIQVGGIPFPHNFFVTTDNMGQKDIILGQPWLFSYSARLDYAHNVGMNLQVWQDGDRDGGQSVRVTLPIMTAPRNVLPIDAIKRRAKNAGVNAIETEITESLDEIPQYFKSVNSFFDDDLNLKKLRPQATTLEAIVHSLHTPPIREVLRRAYFVQNVVRENDLTTKLMKTMLREGYSFHQSSERSDSITRYILGNRKYKPVGKKVHPVASYNPDSRPLELRPLELGTLPSLPVNPTKMEDLKYTTRITKERLALMLGKIPKDFLSKAEIELVAHVVLTYEDAFAFDESERGTFNTKYYPPYEIPTVPHVPWMAKNIRIPHGRMEEFMQLIQEQFESGKYERSTSAYRSAIFAVEKKSGFLRLVHDLQPLNAVTIRDAGLPPRVDDTIEQFTGRQVYCICDLKSGYDSYLLAEKSRDLTSFHAYRLGSLRLTRLPQGFTNSLQVFCRTTSHMVGSMAPNRADVFVDDCAGMGPRSNYGNATIEGNDEIRQFIFEFATTLQELLARIKESGATVAGQKAILATPRLALLGAIVSKDGAHVSHELNAKLNKWPYCKNPSEVQGFLGTVGVVRRWIKDFAIIAKPLTKLTRKMAPNEFKWSDEAQKSMDELKRLASSAVPIKAIDYELARKVPPESQRSNDEGLVSIAVDSSVIGCGWIVSQQIGGIEYPIVFGSTTFNETESRYSQPKLELYGVFRALNAERYRLHGIHFRLILDASYIAKMLNNPGLPNATMTRWIAYILLFDFEIQHNPAAKHKGPDGLSRRHRAIDDSDESDCGSDIEDGIKIVSVPKHQELDDELLNVDTNTAFAPAEPQDHMTDFILQQTKLERLDGECKPLEVYWVTPIDIEEDQEFGVFESEIMDVDENSAAAKRDHPHKVYEHDTPEYWNELLAYLTSLKLPEDRTRRSQIASRAKHFFIYDNMLWRRNGDKPPLQVVLSSEIRTRICKDAHDDSGHRGRDPTFRKIRDSYWWPNMYNFVAQYCQTCHECQLRSTYRNKIPIQPQYTRTLLRRFDIDSVNMPKGKHGFKYVVDLVDNLTGFLEAVKLRRIVSEKIAEFLFDVMCRYGCIFQLTMDNGSEFKNAVQALMDKYKVPIVRTSSYNPQANGKSERGHAVWISALWKIKGIQIYEWPDYLGYAIWADRITVKRTTGYSPYYLLYGQHPLMPYDVHDRTFHSLDWPSVTTTEELLALRIIQLSKKDELLEEAVKANNKSRLKAADAFNRKHAARMTTGDYKPGEWVIVYNEALDNQHGLKGTAKWFGPFIIVQRRPSGAYIIQQPDGVVLRKPIAWKRLKLYHFRKNTEPIVRPPVWYEHEDDIVDAAVITRNHPRPWELSDPDEVNQYWSTKYKSWQDRLLVTNPKDVAPGNESNDGEQEFWDFSHDFPDLDEDPPRFPNGINFQPRLFEWLPWGGRGHQASAFQTTVRNEELKPCKGRVFVLEPQYIYTNETQPPFSSAI